MLSFLRGLLDIILPRRDRIVRIDNYRAERMPVTPQEEELCGRRVTTLMFYRDPRVEDLIRALKYDASRHAAELLAEILAEYLREEIIAHKLFSALPVMLVPVPLHASRLAERGFNQVEKVFKYLPDEFRNSSLSHIENRALVRSRATAPQTHLTRAERRENVQGAFHLNDPAPLRGSRVILIDDVTTTGATLAEAARPFFDAHIDVSLIALARA